MTEADIAEIRARAEGARDGKWYWHGGMAPLEGVLALLAQMDEKDAEIARLRSELRLVDAGHQLRLLYSIRRELGWNDKFDLSLLDSGVKELRVRAEKAEIEIDRLRGALDLWESYGCPICHGDCASANPPVEGCPVIMSRAALARQAPASEEGGNA